MQAVRASTRRRSRGQGPDALFRFPVLMTLNISSSVIGATFGNGTLHLPAFCFRFSLMVLLSTCSRARSAVPPLRWAPARVAPGSHLCSIDFATVEQIRRDGPLGLLGVVRRRGVLLAVRLQAAPTKESAAACGGRAGRAGQPGGHGRLLHLGLLLEALLVEELRAQPFDLLRVLRAAVHHARLLLAPGGGRTRGVRAGPGDGAGAGAALLALEVVHAEAMALLVQLDVLVLRLHSEERGSASPESARAELLPRSSTRAPAGGGAARSRRRERGRTIGADPRWC